MFTVVRHIQTHHPCGNIPGQPSQAPESGPQQPRALTNGNGTAPTFAVSQPPVGITAPSTPSANPSNSPPTDSRHPSANSPPAPAPEADFQHSLHELAQALVLKEQQIEYLIKSLPGLGNSEADQERRMRELEAELRGLEGERREMEGVREGLVESLGRAITGIGGVRRS